MKLDVLIVDGVHDGTLALNGTSVLTISKFDMRSGRG